MDAYDISENKNFKTFQILPIPDPCTSVEFNSISVGKHVACSYSEDGRWYLAIVLEKNEEEQECLLQFYQPPGEIASIRGFKSTTNSKDQAWIPCVNVLKNIDSLEKTSRSGRTFKLSPTEYAQVSELFTKKMQDS
jgi:hypothetical protein